MNPDSTVEVIEAIETALRGDAALTALVAGRIYERPPQAATFPFVLFGDVLGRPVMETFSGDDLTSGFELAVTLEVWSQTRSRKEAALILKAMSDELLELSLPTKALVAVDMLDQRIPPTEEGQRPFGWQRWRIVTDG